MPKARGKVIGGAGRPGRGQKVFGFRAFLPPPDQAGFFHLPKMMDQRGARQPRGAFKMAKGFPRIGAINQQIEDRQPTLVPKGKAYADDRLGFWLGH